MKKIDTRRLRPFQAQLTHFPEDYFLFFKTMPKFKLSKKVKMNKHVIIVADLNGIPAEHCVKLPPRLHICPLDAVKDLGFQDCIRMPGPMRARISKKKHKFYRHHSARHRFILQTDTFPVQDSSFHKFDKIHFIENEPQNIWPTIPKWCNFPVQIRLFRYRGQLKSLMANFCYDLYTVYKNIERTENKYWIVDNNRMTKIQLKYSNFEAWNNVKKNYSKFLPTLSFTNKREPEIFQFIKSFNWELVRPFVLAADLSLIAKQNNRLVDSFAQIQNFYTNSSPVPHPNDTYPFELEYKAFLSSRTSAGIHLFEHKGGSIMFSASPYSIHSSVRKYVGSFLYLLKGHLLTSSTHKNYVRTGTGLIGLRTFQAESRAIRLDTNEIQPLLDIINNYFHPCPRGTNHLTSLVLDLIEQIESGMSAHMVSEKGAWTGPFVRNEIFLDDARLIGSAVNVLRDVNETGFKNRYLYDYFSPKVNKMLACRRHVFLPTTYRSEPMTLNTGTELDTLFQCIQHNLNLRLPFEKAEQLRFQINLFAHFANKEQFQTLLFTFDTEMYNEWLWPLDQNFDRVYLKSKPIIPDLSDYANIFQRPRIYFTKNEREFASFYEIRNQMEIKAPTNSALDDFLRYATDKVTQTTFLPGAANCVIGTDHSIKGYVFNDYVYSNKTIIGYVNGKTAFDAQTSTKLGTLVDAYSIQAHRLNTDFWETYSLPAYTRNPNMYGNQNFYGFMDQDHFCVDLDGIPIGQKCSDYVIFNDEIVGFINENKIYELGKYIGTFENDALTVGQTTIRRTEPTVLVNGVRSISISGHVFEYGNFIGTVKKTAPYLREILNVYNRTCFRYVQCKRENAPEYSFANGIPCANSRFGYSVLIDSPELRVDEFDFVPLEQLSGKIVYDQNVIGTLVGNKVFCEHELIGVKAFKKVFCSLNRFTSEDQLLNKIPKTNFMHQMLCDAFPEKAEKIKVKFTEEQKDQINPYRIANDLLAVQNDQFTNKLHQVAKFTCFPEVLKCLSMKELTGSKWLSLMDYLNTYKPDLIHLFNEPNSESERMITDLTKQFDDLCSRKKVEKSPQVKDELEFKINMVKAQLQSCVVPNEEVSVNFDDFGTRKYESVPQDHIPFGAVPASFEHKEFKETKVPELEPVAETVYPSPEKKGFLSSIFSFYSPPVKKETPVNGKIHMNDTFMLRSDLSEKVFPPPTIKLLKERNISSSYTGMYVYSIANYVSSLVHFSFVNVKDYADLLAVLNTKLVKACTVNCDSNPLVIDFESKSIRNIDPKDFVANIQICLDQLDKIC